MSALPGKNRYPLRTGYRIIYWIIMIAFAAIFVASLIRGQIAFPGLVSIAGLIALILDVDVKKNVRAMEAKTCEPPPLPPDTPGQP